MISEETNWVPATIKQIQFPLRAQNMSAFQSVVDWSSREVANRYRTRFDNESRAAARSLVKAIEALTDDWDGYGAERVSDEVVGYAFSVLEILPQALRNPDITPNSNGTISFEWESSSAKAHLELGKINFSLFVKPRAGRPLFAEGRCGHIDFEIASKIDAMLFAGVSNSVSDFKLSAVVDHAQFLR